jgi:transcriptional regulator with XRE-family HTH domain
MKLKAWLNKEGLSKTEFAKKVGITRHALYLYLKGKRQPRLDIALRIEEATNGEVTVKDLISPFRKPTGVR